MSKLRKTSDGNMPVRASLLAEKVEGASTISVSGLAGWAQGQRQDFIICKYDSDKKIVPGSVTSWTGVPASNGTIGALQLTGGQDQQYPIGAAVVSSPTSAWANDLIDALLVHHDANGRLRPNTVTYDHIDEKTEYKFIASPNDLNDAQFLVPGKWRFGNSQQVGSTKNLPLANNTGMLETISHSGGATRPGTHAWSYALQIFTTLSGRIFIRGINSAESASNIKFGAWREFMQKNIEKHTKDSRGWIKRELPDGVVEYSITSRIGSTYTAGGAWAGDRYIDLPVGVGSFKRETMSACVSVIPADTAISASAAIDDGWNRWTITRVNNYTQGITTTLLFNAILRVYPE